MGVNLDFVSCPVPMQCRSLLSRMSRSIASTALIATSSGETVLQGCIQDLKLGGREMWSGRSSALAWRR